MAWALKILIFGFLAGIVAVAGFIGYLAIARNSPLQLPAPTGSYPVGRIIYDWQDASRSDPLADQANTPRELEVWVWYPSASAGKSSAPYLPPVWVAARNKDQGIGYLIENDFNRLQTHSFEDVPLATTQATFPILIMEPGMGPIAEDYTIFAENLASHGYIVVGINPTDTSNLIVFPDGRVALRTHKGTIPNSDTSAQFNADGNRIEAVWVKDVLFVMKDLSIPRVPYRLPMPIWSPSLTNL
jgi:predicted dienelactone hydrolase